MSLKSRSPSPKTSTSEQEVPGATDTPSEATAPMQGIPAPAQGSEAAGVPATAPAPEPTSPPSLVPVSPPAPRRKIDLTTALDAALTVPEAVESLQVRAMKGPGQTFTPAPEGWLAFNGLVYQAEGEFEKVYQVLAGELLRDPRVVSRACRITFVPALDWTTHETILLPVKMSRFGDRVLADIERLRPRIQEIKLIVEWSHGRRRHVVSWLPLDEHEAELLAKVKWPTRDEILEALQAHAYDDPNELAAANAEIRTLLTAREVG